MRHSGERSAGALWKHIAFAGAWAYLWLIVSGLSLALLVQVGSAIFGTKTKLPMEKFFQDRRTALLLVLMAVLLAPVVEETFFEVIFIR